MRSLCRSKRAINTIFPYWKPLFLRTSRSTREISLSSRTSFLIRRIIAISSRFSSSYKDRNTPQTSTHLHSTRGIGREKLFRMCDRISLISRNTFWRSSIVIPMDLPCFFGLPTCLLGSEHSGLLNDSHWEELLAHYRAFYRYDCGAKPIFSRLTIPARERYFMPRNVLLVYGNKKVPYGHI